MDPFLSLANRVFEVVMSNQTCINTWGVYLFDADFDKEQELRNKLGTIWLCSLLDTLEAQYRFLPEIAREAKTNGWSSLEQACQQLEKFCVVVGEVLEMYSREEQIFLVNLRNQFVHSYLAGRHREAIPVKYCSGGKLVSETIPSDEYHAIANRFFFGSLPLDPLLSSLLSRALNRNLRYWQAVGVFQQSADTLYKVIREGKNFTVTI